MSQVAYPSTINLNIIEPRKLIEPVNYYEKFNNSINELNAIYESREAQKRAYEKLASDALLNIDALQSFGYSTSFNNIISKSGALTKSNINTYYSELINGQIDPIDFPQLINTEVNNFYATIKSLSIVNTKIYNVINNLKNQNKFELIEMVSQIVDNVCSNSSISPTYQKVDKNKRYYMFTSLQTAYNFKKSINTCSEFNTNFLNPLEKLENLSFGPKEEHFQNQIIFDKSILQSVSFGDFNVLLPFSFSKQNEFDKNIQKEITVFQRDYANLSQLKLRVNFGKVPSKYNSDATLAIKQLKENTNVKKLYFGLTTSQTNDGVITEITSESPAFKAGILIGDRIESINGFEYKSDTIFDHVKKNKNVGDSISISLIRQGKKIQTALALGLQPSYISSFDFDYKNIKGFFSCWEYKKEDFGDITKSIFCQSFVPLSAEYVVSMNFDIKLPETNSNYSSNDYFNLFKPVLKEIINSVSAAN
jgi:hypothetical protein